MVLVALIMKRPEFVDGVLLGSGGFPASPMLDRGDVKNN